MDESEFLYLQQMVFTDLIFINIVFIMCIIAYAKCVPDKCVVVLIISTAWGGNILRINIRTHFRNFKIWFYGSPPL